MTPELLGWGLRRADKMPAWAHQAQPTLLSKWGKHYAGGKKGAGPSTPPLLGCFGAARERDRERKWLQDTRITCLCITAVKNVSSNKKLTPEAEISTELFKLMTAMCISLRVEGIEI